MEIEELFCKRYPEYSVNGKIPLSPYFDVFEEGYEQAEIENAELKEKLKPENCLKLLAKGGYVKFTNEQLTKATDLLKKMYYLYFDPCVTHKDLENRDKLFEEVKQFLKE